MPSKIWRRAKMAGEILWRERESQNCLDVEVITCQMFTTWRTWTYHARCRSMELTTWDSDLTMVPTCATRMPSTRWCSAESNMLYCLNEQLFHPTPVCVHDRDETFVMFNVGLCINTCLLMQMWVSTKEKKRNEMSRLIVGNN